MKSNFKLSFIAIIAIILFSSCKKEEEEPVDLEAIQQELVGQWNRTDTTSLGIFTYQYDFRKDSLYSYSSSSGSEALGLKGYYSLKITSLSGSITDKGSTPFHYRVIDPSVDATVSKVKLKITQYTVGTTYTPIDMKSGKFNFEISGDKQSLVLDDITYFKNEE